MKKLSLILLFAFLAGCAASPEDIAAKYTSGEQYKGWSCEKILAERKSVASDLAVASAKQEETRSDDIAGVILLAMPVGSMSGEDLAPEIARLKGERHALDRIAKQNKCAGAVAALNPSPPTSAKPISEPKVKIPALKTMNIPDGELSGEQIKKVLEGKVLVGHRATGERDPRTLHFKPNGKLSGELMGYGNLYHADEGDWSIDSGQKLCMRWDNWDFATRECFRVKKRGKELLLLETGARLAWALIVPN